MTQVPRFWVRLRSPLRGGVGESLVFSSGPLVRGPRASAPGLFMARWLGALTSVGRGRHSFGMSDSGELPVVPAAPASLPGRLELGAFSVSLSVADLDASREFYEKLGFEVTGGATEQNYLILKNGETTIGLFHGMFEGNILTFNPGLTNRMERLESYADVRTIQAALEDEGVALQTRAEGEAGPASITLTDPDGNAVLIDQFF